MLGPTERFSSRVDDYVRYRPFYPSEILALLKKECGLTSEWIIADIGAGPGNLSRLFLENGNRVLGIEPNREMREAGAKLLQTAAPNFISLIGTAERTDLGPSSIDLVCAGQAFHWFDQENAKKEFARILKPHGWVALVWNMRRIDESTFSAGYEDILRKIPEYEKVKADGAPLEELRAFFAPGEVRQATFPNQQVMSREAFIGRVLSSSYVPQEGTPGHEAVIAAVEALFDRESTDGEVRFVYDTEVYYGQMEGLRDRLD